MYLISIFWAIFAVAWLFRDSDYRYFYTVTGLGYAILIAVFAHFLNKRRQWAWWGALTLTGISIILTITDQVGWFDMVYLVPAVVLFIMLFTARLLFKKQITAT